MGGFGSGRQPWTRRDTVEQRYGLDVRRLSREHLLAPGTQFDWQWCRDDQVVAEVTVRVEAQHVVMAYGWEPPDGPLTGVECRVGLDRTPCPYGGARTWFRCPAPGCGRRITKLFLAGAGVACRHCLHLNYWSQRLRPIDRGLRRIDQLERRLNGGKAPSGLLLAKPKWMQWRTYEHRRSEIGTIQLRTLLAMLDRVERGSTALT